MSLEPSDVIETAIAIVLATVALAVIPRLFGAGGLDELVQRTIGGDSQRSSIT